MTESDRRKPSQSGGLLLLGILLTLLAVVGHRFLPERRLTIDSARQGANFFPVESGSGVQAKFEWIDQPHFHYSCQFPQVTVLQGCGFAYMLTSGADASRGIDLSRFRTLNLAVRYTGQTQYLRVGIRNFDPRFSTVEDLNSPKFNFVNIPPRDLAQPISISLSEFAVAEWWTTAYNHPREYSRPDLSNATVLNIDLQGELGGTRHEIQIDRIEFVGDWISAEYWYLGILSLWMVLGTVYGTSQWLRMRRKQRLQREKIRKLEHEKEKYQKLSTVDALTNVLNRHGIDQFIAALRESRVPASVIVIDLDHFKLINDQRGHYGGDRVLRTMGEILRSHSRSTDGLGRWGGEEFVLVLPGTSLGMAVELAEKLRQKIHDTDFFPQDPLLVTASFGVAASSADQSFEDAFRQADQALYLAKSRGRNCVVAANEDQMHKMTGARRSTWAMISGRFKLHG
ncbi:MAG TPA: GGDEF domain-containing protein [Steroidobacteraceae bacterium]|nr:GGDEF domain-containing protein [Steroidobacteraceae bacterium]